MLAMNVIDMTYVMIRIISLPFESTTNNILLCANHNKLCKQL